jgi:hypothetical protein
MGGSAVARHLSAGRAETQTHDRKRFLGRKNVFVPGVRMISVAMRNDRTVEGLHRVDKKAVRLDLQAGWGRSIHAGSAVMQASWETKR